MAVYAYKAVGSDRSTASGSIIADTPRQARDLLRARGLTPQELRPQVPSSAISWWARLRGRRQAARVVTFARELSTLLAVGIPLLEALDSTIRQHRGAFRGRLLLLRERVADGAGLAEAMRQQPEAFDALCTDLVEVGESAGDLERALAQLAEFKERSARFRNRLTTALLYPCFVLIVGVVVTVLLMTFVVPNLLEALVREGRPLPWATRLVLAASDLLVHRWWLLLGGAAGLAGALALVLRTERGAWAWHRLQLKLPVVGNLLRKQAVVRIAVVMPVLLRSGVVFLRAVEIARRSVRNRVLRHALEVFEQSVQAGRQIAPALEATGAFPSVVVQIFAVGQQSGRLEEMLDRLARDYDQELTTAAQRFTAVLEPLFVLCLAVFVLIIALATMMPILEASHVL